MKSLPKVNYSRVQKRTQNTLRVLLSLLPSPLETASYTKYFSSCHNTVRICILILAARLLLLLL